MTFLYPQILWALSLLAIPIIIHFFSFRKVKVVKFTAVHFLKNVDDSTKNKRRIKHWLILLSRLLFLIFLILAFAQPTLEGTSSVGVKTIIFLDNSYSMSNEVANGQSGLEEAVDFVNGIINSSPFEAQYQLVTHDDYAITDSWLNGSRLKEKITELSFTSQSFSISKLLEQHEQLGQNVELYIVSDFQKTFIEDASIFSGRKNISLIPVSSSEISNIYVDSVYLSSPVVYQDQPNELVVKLRNMGDPEEEIQVKLINEDKLLGTSSVEMSSSVKTISFHVEANSVLSPRLKIELLDFPVTFDNTYYFVWENYTRPVVTHVKADQLSTNYIQTVFANSSLFDFQSISLADPDYSRINSSDLVIIEGVDQLPSWIQSVESDFDVLIIPTVDFIASWVVKSQQEELRKLRVADEENPYVKNIFEGEVSSQLDFPTAQILHRVKQPKQVLLSDPFGNPFLSVIESPQRVFFLSVPLNDSFTNFGTHALFVPIMYKMAQLSNRVENPLAYDMTDEAIRFKMNGIDPLVESKIQHNDFEFVPNLISRRDIVTIQIPEENLESGYYSFIQGTDTLRMFALNQSSGESDLRQFYIEDLQEQLSGNENSQVLSVDSSIALENVILDKYSGTRLWKYALAISLFFILLEVLFIRLLK